MSDFDFASAILSWYNENGRDLPWRGTRDPYRIWISEIILQQTRVSQGYDYFLRFMARFPDVQALADASEDEVLKCWQGLGYYSRARNLHAAAKQVVAGGGFPADYAAIRKLKGVGDYTAAAIASFAYGLPHAVVDGNVYRVLSRYFGVDIPIDTAKGRRYFAGLAQELLTHVASSSDYNQALMDFGALQCTPQSPGCDACPLEDSCAAKMCGKVQDLPVKSRTQQTKCRFLHYIYIEAAGEVAVFRRESNDIWKGLYELYLVETPNACPPGAVFAGALVPDFLRHADAQRTLLCTGVRHQLTHRTLACDFYKVSLPRKPAAFGRDVVWAKPCELSRYAWPRLLAALLERFGLM